jgi:AraC-like DNA-binding protein
VAGLDSGSWLLARADLLNGYRATSHWDILSSLAEGFPDVDVVTDRVVIDRDRASCGGATSTLDLMLDLIGRRHGTALALDVAALFLYGGQAEHAAPHMPMLPQRTLREAAALMRKNLEAPIPIGTLARRLGLSQRKLEALFRTHADLTPVQLYRRIRLGEARRRVLETTHTIAEIAGRCGYGDPAAMTRAFRVQYGVAPTELRRDARRRVRSDAARTDRAICLNVQRRTPDAHDPQNGPDMRRGQSGFSLCAGCGHARHRGPCPRAGVPPAAQCRLRRLGRRIPKPCAGRRDHRCHARRGFEGQGFLPGVVDRDRNQTEFRRTTEDYLALVASEEDRAAGPAPGTIGAAVLAAISSASTGVDAMCWRRSGAWRRASARGWVRSPSSPPPRRWHGRGGAGGSSRRSFWPRSGSSSRATPRQTA